MQTGLGTTPPTRPPVAGTPGTPLIVLSDLGTVVAAAIESQLYTGSVNWMNCGKAGFVGAIARLIEGWFIQYMPQSVQSLSRDQKNQFLVFVLAALWSRMTDKKRSALLVGFKNCSNDLMGSYLLDFFNITDAVIVGPMWSR